MEKILAILSAISGLITIIGSVIAMRFSGLTFIVLLILELLNVINIGMYVIWYPLIMLFGGLLAMLLGIVIAAIAAEHI